MQVHRFLSQGEKTRMFNFTKMDSIPTLPKRESNIDRFSMYLMLNTQNERLVLKWQYQPYLKRNMELYQKMNEEFSKLCSQLDKGRGLAQFWRNIVLNEALPKNNWEPEKKGQLAWEHLASYFEERCYWAAKQICQEQDERSWEECLCLARLLIYNPLKLRDILAKYDSNKANLDSYISESLEKNIKYEAEVNRFSRWRLLCKKSDIELKEALQVTGRGEPEISQLLFARKYFKQVYLFNNVKNPNRKAGKKWSDPEQEDFDKTAQCYNVEKTLPSAPHEVSANSTYVTGKQIQTSMEICIAALQNYPKSIVPKFSIDALQAVGREAKSEVQEDISEIEWQGTLAVEAAEEEQQGLSQTINSALRQQLEAMKPDYQKLLLLYYGFGLTQQQLAVKLGINQSSVSRYLTKSTIKLLDTVAGISQPRQWVEEYVSGWLYKNYTAPNHSDLIQSALVLAIKKLATEEREVLQLYYGKQMNETKIVKHSDIRENEVEARLIKANYQLQENLLKQINIWIEEYLEKWLSKHYQFIIDSIWKDISRDTTHKFSTLNRELELEIKMNAVVEAYLKNKVKSI